MNTNSIFLIIFIFVFIIYHLFYIQERNSPHYLNENKESFKLVKKHSCEDDLYQVNNLVYLKNSKEPSIPGINPKLFTSYNEYKKYNRYLEKQGTFCPVLYLKDVETTQGDISKKVYSSKREATELPGLPFINNEIEMERDLISASLETNPNSYPGSDKSRLDNGIETPLDKMFHSHDRISVNAMDSNWGGISFTDSKLNDGEIVR